jgi:3-oxoacyl-[acyl-carrier protein] reductase
VHVLVNNAGILRRGSLAQHSAAERERVLRVNLGGTFNCIQAVLPVMRSQRPAGAIVNVSSIAGAAGDLTAAPSYGASKGGVNALTKSMARELGPDGIRVNAICPAAKTRLMQAWIDEDPDQAAAVEATIPLRRFGDPDVDIPLAAVFLASDLSRYVTGHTLMVDGGSCKF